MIGYETDNNRMSDRKRRIDDILYLRTLLVLLGRVNPVARLVSI